MELTIQEIADLKEGRKTLEQIQTEKCTIALKDVKELIAPILNQIGIKVPSDEADGSYDFVMDTIARFYRDNYNTGGDTFSSESITKETHSFKGNTEFTMSLRNQAKYGNALPSELDMQDQINNNHYLAVKVKNGGITISVLDGKGTKNMARESRKAVRERDERLASRFWDSKKADEIWENHKRGKTTQQERDLQLRKHYTSLVNHKMETRNLNYTLKKNRVPISTYYVDVPNSY